MGCGKVNLFSGPLNFSNSRQKGGDAPVFLKAHPCKRRKDGPPRSYVNSQKGWPPAVESRYGNNKQQLFHFNDKAKHEFFSYRHRRTIYRGWFEHLGKEWVPLLIAEPRTKWSLQRRWFTPPPAVLLAKCYGHGILLASTMWLAVPGAEDLVHQILTIRPEVVAEAHEKYFERRKFVDGVWFAAIIAAFVLLMKGLNVLGSAFYEYVGKNSELFLLPLRVLYPAVPVFLCFIQRWFPANWSILEDVGVVWFSIIIYRFWQNMIRRRPHGVNPLQFCKSGWDAFKDTF